MFEELDPLWHSPTIKPSFELVHVILALFIFEENREGMGRYRLQKELSIGSGTAKSLIRKLNEDLNFIIVLSDEKGHILTKTGLEFVQKIKHKLSLIKAGDSSVLKDIIVKSEGKFSYFCIVRNAIDKLINGIEQRDAAIKIGGVGATCILYNGKDLVFPSYKFTEENNTGLRVDDAVFKYIYALINEKDSYLEENDAIIIGIGDNLKKARLAALNAALTLL